MQFGKDLQAHKGGFVDDENGMDLLVQQLFDSLVDDSLEGGAGEASGLHVEGGGNLPVQFENGAAGGGDPDSEVL